MNMNPSFIQMARMMSNMGSSQNPTQMIMNLLGPRANNNPILSNALNMMNTNNTTGLEQLAQQVCKSKGININDLSNQIKSLI